uniref:Transposon protein, putative, unclassified n=1 Tax=Oryza sativa subsp. japonica TaxID=39947 RepID=Q10T18_ORYSJ|nr:transposon protein, putative, unclassified [Oryza sativa Japonica Group]
MAEGGGEGGAHPSARERGLRRRTSTEEGWTGWISATRTRRRRRRGLAATLTAASGDRSSGRGGGKGLHGAGAMGGSREYGGSGKNEIPSHPLRHSKSDRSEAEETVTAEARRWEADRREAADRLREAEEAAQEAVRVRQAEEAAREEARLRRAEESVREAEAARARQAASQASDPTPPETTTTSEATHDEAASAPLGPDPSGDAWDKPASGDAPRSSTSIGGQSRAAPTPRRLSPLPSAAPLSAEPLLQALAAANTTVLDGLSA